MNSKNPPLVSVVLTSFNQKELLKRAVNSLLAQTYSNLEIIIVDDCSTDGSVDYIKELSIIEASKVLFYIQERNVGIPKNKNTGFRMAKGDFITFLDGDDFYYPNKVEMEIKEFENDPTLDVVFSNFNFLDFQGRVKEKWINDPFFSIPRYALNEIANRSFPKSILFRFELMRKDVLEKINYYNENISIYHDWDSRIRYSLFSKIGFTNNIGSVYIEDPSGITQKNKQLILINQMLYVLELNRSNLISRKISTKELSLNLKRSLLLLKISDQNYTKTKKCLFVISYILQNPGDLELYSFFMNKI